MTLLGAEVPLSGWTLIVLVTGITVSLLAWRPVAGWRRWQPSATLAGLLVLTVVLALTVAPGTNRPPVGLAACIPHHGVHDLLRNLLPTGGGVAGSLLNLLLLLPLTLTVVLATGRVRPAVAVAVLVPLTVELVQTQLPGRSCVVSDLLANVTGALLGAALGRLARRWLHRAHPHTPALSSPARMAGPTSPNDQEHPCPPQDPGTPG